MYNNITMVRFVWYWGTYPIAGWHFIGIFTYDVITRHVWGKTDSMCGRELIGTLCMGSMSTLRERLSPKSTRYWNVI